MRELIADKIPFIKSKVTKEEAKKIYMSLEQPDKIGVIDSLDMDMVTIYSCGDWNDRHTYRRGVIIGDEGPQALADRPRRDRNARDDECHPRL